MRVLFKVALVKTEPLLTAFGLYIKFMMASYNLSLVQYSWRPQLQAKQLLYTIYPLPFNVSYFLDNIYFASVSSTHTTLIYPPPWRQNALDARLT